MSDDTEGPLQRTIKCPRCGTENISWRSRCNKCGENLHKNETGLPKFEKRGAGFWIAFIVGVVGLSFESFVYFFDFYLSGYSHLPVAVIVMLAFPVLGLVLCWKWPGIAGIAFLIGGILPTILTLVVTLAEGSSQDLGGYLLLLGMAVPLIISGIIFFMIGKE